MSEEMYGDGGVDYAEKIFAEQRERNRVEAKKQEDFAKKLQLFDIGLRGVNFLINQRADNLEAKQIPALTAYRNTLETLNKTKDTLTKYKNSPNKSSYISDYIYNNSINNILSTYNYLDEKDVQREVRNYANNQAKILEPEFDRMYEELSDIPDFETFQNQYAKYAKRQTPRNLFSLTAKALKNLFKSETANSLKVKSERAKDAIFNTDLFNNIQGAKKAVEEFYDKGFNVTDMITNIENAVNQGTIAGKKIDEFTKDKISVGIGPNGETLTETVFLGLGYDPTSKKQTVQIIGTGIVGVDKSTKITVTQEEKKQATAIFLGLIKNTTSPTTDQIENLLDVGFTGVSEDEAKDTRLIIGDKIQRIAKLTNISVEDAARYVQEELYKIYQDEENTLSIEEILISISRGIKQPTLFQVDVTNEKFSLDKFANYAESAYEQGGSELLIREYQGAKQLIENMVDVPEDRKLELLDKLKQTYQSYTNVNIDTNPSELNLNNNVNANNTDNNIDDNTDENNEELFTKDSELNVAEPISLKTLQEKNAVARFAAFNRNYLKNFDAVVNSLNLDDLSFEELQYLRNISDKQLAIHLGLPSGFEIERSPFSFDITLNKVVDKYMKENRSRFQQEMQEKYPDMFKEEKYAFSNKTYLTVSRDITRLIKQPSVAFFQNFQNKLIA